MFDWRIEVEYVTKLDGKTLSIFHTGGYTWTAWLEGKGNVAIGWSAEATLAETNKKLGLSLTESDFEFINH